MQPSPLLICINKKRPKVSTSPEVPTDDEIRQLMERVLHAEEGAEAELKQLLNAGVEFFLRRAVPGTSALEVPVQEVLRLTVLVIRTRAVGSTAELSRLVVRAAKGY